MSWTFHLATKLHLQNKLLAVMGLSSCSLLWFQRGQGPRDDKNEQCGKEVLGEMVSENQGGKLEALRWGEKGWKWVRDCQPSSPPRSRWSHTSLLSPETCSPTALHHVHWHPERQRSLVKIHCLAVKRGRCHVQLVQDAPLDQGPRLFLPLQCVPEVLQGWGALTGAPEMWNKSHARRWSSSISPLCIILDAIWRKQGNRTVCFPPFKAIQISSAMETAGVLSLPFFTGSSTESRAFARKMTALSFHLGASCLTKLIENITPLWPKNESLGEQRHPDVKNEHWKRWSCQFSYQDANKYRGCQAGGSAGPLVQHKDVLQSRGWQLIHHPQWSSPSIESSSEWAGIHIFNPRYYVRLS